MRPQGSFPTGKFGAFTPTGVVFDGTNFRIVARPENENRLFTIAPGGLPVDAYSVTYPSNYSGAPIQSVDDIGFAADGTHFVLVDSLGDMVHEIARNATSSELAQLTPSLGGFASIHDVACSMNDVTKRSSAVSQ